MRHLVHKLPPEVLHPTATPLGVRQEGNTLAKRSGVGMPWSFRKQVAYQCIVHHTRRCICVYWIQHICTLVVNSICKICQGLRDHVRNIFLFQVGLHSIPSFWHFWPYTLEVGHPQLQGWTTYGTWGKPMLRNLYVEQLCYFTSLKSKTLLGSPAPVIEVISGRDHLYRKCVLCSVCK